MKSLVRWCLGLGLMLLVATTGFTFDWISLTNPDSTVTASVSGGYGSLVILPVGITPIGVAAEIAVPGVKGLYAGGSATYLGIEWDDDGDQYDYSLNYFTFGGYAKYIALDRPQMEEMAGLPMFVGAAGGGGYELALSDYAGYDLASDYGGPIFLAVGLVGYEFERSTLTAYAGLIDRQFSWSGEFHFRLNDTMHLGLFWIPLIGLGGTFTISL